MVILAVEHNIDVVPVSKVPERHQLVQARVNKVTKVITLRALVQRDQIPTFFPRAVVLLIIIIMDVILDQASVPLVA